MKNKKSILALALALVMCLGLLAGCGGDDGGSDETEAPESQNVENETPEIEEPEDEDSDLAYIEDKGTMIIGITIYEPMNYYDDNGDLTGFDTEFAELVAEKLGVEPVFQVISWDAKEIELAAKTIDCIWNGMTITADREENMSISLPYVKNAQVLVVREDSDITSTEDLVGQTVVAELGSAGEEQINGEDADEYFAQSVFVGKSMQTDCLLEVKAGTAAAAVLDWTLAKTMAGEGTDYTDLVIVEGVELATEEYGIAFRKGSDITEKINAIIMELVEDGTLDALAEKYGLSLAPALTD